MDTTVYIKSRRVPLAILVTGLLAFGLQIPSLGFYQDDWHFIHYGSAAGARGMLDFLTMDGRPTAAWVYAILYPLLGFSPLPWHVLSLFLRLLTVFLGWSVLQTLWPNRSRTNFVAAIFFLLYPAFALQPQAVVYAEHWTSFVLYFASLLLMMRAIEHPRRYLPFTALAILAGTLQLFTVEYFVGLELLRPLVILIMYAHQQMNIQAGEIKTNASYPKKTIWLVAKAWLPYLLILLLFLYWRSSILGGLGLRNNPLNALSFASIVSTLQNLLADISLILVSSWFKLVDPASLELTRARNFIFLALSFVGGLAAYLYSRTFSEEVTHNAPRDTQPAPITNYHLLITSHASYLLFAALAFLLGLAPAYAANFIIHAKLEPWNGRFALAALPGAAMLVASALEWFVSSENARRVAFAVLVGLLIGFHNRNAYDFKYSWDKQVKLYEQLTWRAPHILPGTAIITDQEILGYMGDYPTSFAFNTMYDTKSLRPSPYWFFAISENFNNDASSLTDGISLETRKYASSFVGNSRDSLVIDFEPEKNQCLWILRPEDASYRPLAAQLKTAALVSNLSRVQDKHDAIPVLYDSIVPENTGSWCFHYERADLARQLGDWGQVIFFWNLAHESGFLPGHGFEYIPFIQAYAHTGGWSQAFALTKDSNRTSDSMRTILCPTWEELVSSTPPSSQRDEAYANVRDLLGCQ